jgi:hypothetical protein
MRVELDNSLFTNLAVSLLDVLAVFQCCGGRHRVFLDHDGAESPGRQWIASQSPPLAEELCLILDASAEEEALRPSGRTLRIHAAGQPQAVDPPRLAPATAIQWLRAPVRLYVENSVNDRAFLLSMAGAFDRQELERRESSGDLAFMHGGGSTLKDQVRAAAQDGQLRWFGFALFDSDAPLPTRRNVLMDDFRAKLEALGFHHHQLQRRAAENYLSPSQLQRWAGDRHHTKRAHAWAILEAFLRLPDELQAHYRMREGLAADEKAADAEQWRTELESTYDRLSAADRAALQHGFTSAIRDLFGTAQPTLAEARRHEAEFDPIFQTILSLA